MLEHPNIDGGASSCVPYWTLDSGTDCSGKLGMSHSYSTLVCSCGSVDSAFGAVKNPWLYPYDKPDVEDWYIAGGSSGGSAVAVATGTAFA